MFLFFYLYRFLAAVVYNNPLPCPLAELFVLPVFRPCPLPRTRMRNAAGNSADNARRNAGLLWGDDVERSELHGDGVVRGAGGP